MKTGVVEEAEDLLKEDNGSKSKTGKCETHSGHTLEDMTTCGQPPLKGLGPHHVHTYNLLWTL